MWPPFSVSPKRAQTKKRVPAWKNLALLLLTLVCLPVPGAGGRRNKRMSKNKRKSSESSIGALVSQTKYFSGESGTSIEN